MIITTIITISLNALGTMEHRHTAYRNPAMSLIARDVKPLGKMDYVGFCVGSSLLQTLLFKLPYCLVGGWSTNYFI